MGCPKKSGRHGAIAWRCCLAFEDHCNSSHLWPRGTSAPAVRGRATAPSAWGSARPGLHVGANNQGKQCSQPGDAVSVVVVRSASIWHGKREHMAWQNCNLSSSHCTLALPPLPCAALTTLHAQRHALSRSLTPAPLGVALQGEHVSQRPLHISLSPWDGRHQIWHVQQRVQNACRERMGRRVISAGWEAVCRPEDVCPTAPCVFCSQPEVQQRQSPAQTSNQRPRRTSPIMPCAAPRYGLSCQK